MGPAFLIVGTPRSGTTLVQRLACELDRVVVPPETHFLSIFGSPLLDVVRRGGRADLGTELDRFRSLHTSVGLTLADGDVEAHLAGTARSVLDLFGAVTAALAGGAAVAGEKTPDHLLWWAPVTDAVPELTVVAVVRDPRAVVASYATTWGNRDHVLLAERWALDQRHLAAAVDRLGPRIVTLRYEDVVRDPAAARARLGAIVGAPPRVPAVTAQPLGLPWETWKARAATPVTGERCAIWRDTLTPRRAEIVAALTAPGMRDFGYGDDVPTPAAAARTVAGLDPGALARRLRFGVGRELDLARNAALGRFLTTPRAV